MNVEKQRPLLIIVSAPSGAGKSTICNQVLQTFPGMAYSISCTTRAPRGDERNHEHYHFLTREEFEQKISQEEFDNLGFNSKLQENEIYFNPDIQVRAGQTHRLAFRPEDMIFTAFPIASKIITSQEDDTDDIIASKYRNIYKNNVKLRRHRLGKARIIDEKKFN